MQDGPESLFGNFSFYLTGLVFNLLGMVYEEHII